MKCFWCDKEFEPHNIVTPLCSETCTDEFIEFWESRNDRLYLNPDHPVNRTLRND